MALQNQSLFNQTNSNFNQSTIDDLNITGIVDLSSAVITGIDTDDVAEASNLYFTENRVSTNTSVVANTDHSNTVVGNPHNVVLADLGISDLGSSAIITTNERNKIAEITITQPVNLDTLETDVTTNNTKISYTDAATVALNTVKISYTDAAAVALNTDKISYTDAAAVALNTAKISYTDAVAVGLNTDKISYTDGVAVTLNTAKIAYTDAGAVALNTVKISFTDAAAVALNTAKISYTDAVAVGLNTAKISYTDASAVALNTAKISFDSTSSTKLSGIEALADVTDSTNVLASGACMVTGAQSITGQKTFSTNPIIDAIESGVYTFAMPTGSIASDYLVSKASADYLRFKHLMDGDCGLSNTVDNSKLCAFDLSGITTGNTRTLSIQDASGAILVDTVDVTNLDNNTVIAKTLAGFSSGSGTVAASDSILSAIEKLNGLMYERLPLAGGSMTGTIISKLVYPSTDVVSDLGATSNRYRDLYVERVMNIQHLWMTRTTQVTMTSAASTLIPFNSTVLTQGNITFPSAGKVTFGTAGVYQISCLITAITTGAFSFYQIFSQLNQPAVTGTAYAFRTYNKDTTSNYVFDRLTFTLKIDAGDDLYLWLTLTGTGTIKSPAGTSLSSRSNLMITKISDY